MKAYNCVDHNKLCKILKEMEIPDHLTCLLRNLYAGQNATVRTLYGTTDWLRTEKGARQACLLSPCLFNPHTELPWWLRLQYGIPGFNPWVGNIPWRREWQSTPLFLTGEFHEHRSLAGYRPWGCKELDTTERLTLSQETNLSFSLEGDSISVFPGSLL